MTEQTPESTPQGQAPVPTPPPGSEPDKGKQPPWGDPENFNAEQAWQTIQNLRKEKQDPAMRAELTALQQQQAQQRDALAAALGLKPEETSDTDRLAETVGSLQQQILASERRALAAEHKVPEALLTGGDAEAMRAQAQALVEFANAAHVAAAQPPAPGFVQNPGQGQGGAPLTPEALAAAEYEKFYPASKR